MHWIQADLSLEIWSDHGKSSSRKVDAGTDANAQLAPETSGFWASSPALCLSASIEMQILTPLPEISRTWNLLHVSVANKMLQCSSCQHYSDRKTKERDRGVNQSID